MTEHASHQHDQGGANLTRMAVSATLHCLTGCAIGEVLGMVLATWWGLANGPSIALAVGLVLVFEGLMPLVAPARWREMMSRVIALADGQIRFFGLALIFTGLVIVGITD